jgi:branched-chain amino acid transport system permease protein
MIAESPILSNQSLLKPILWATLVALFALVPVFLESYQLSLLTLILVYSLLAMSVDLLAGFAGRTPLCHGALFGCGAYGVMYFVSTLRGDPLIGVVLALGLVLSVSLVFALLATRTSGVYFLLLTLALGMIVWGVCQRWTSVSGGENGLRGAIRPEWLLDPLRYYYFVLLCASLLSWTMYRVVSSPFGLTLKGIRESESRMKSLGYNTTLHLTLGFCLSGLVAGASGILYAFLNSFVSPTTVSLSQSVKGLLMAIIGGVGTLFGGVVGATLIILLENLVSSMTERWSMVLGAMFVLTMIFVPSGILGKLRTVLVDHSGNKKSAEG